jgi:hypothetical protein
MKSPRSWQHQTSCMLLPCRTATVFHHSVKVCRRNVRLRRRMLAATGKRLATSASIPPFNSPLLFCKFTDGSRRVTLRTRAAAHIDKQPATEATVHLIPMAHAATKDFFDKVLEFIADESRTCAGVTDPHATPAIKRGAVRVLMEGLAATDTDRDTEQQEWQFLHQKVVDARAGLADADRFLFDFTRKVETNTLYKPETQRSIAASYELPFPLPDKLLLQDAYFRPLAAARFSPFLASGDICLADYPPSEQQALMADGQKLRVEREKHCAGEVRRLVAGGTSLVFVPWGHFHAPSIMGRLMTADRESSAPGSDLAFDIADAEAEPTTYGWTDAMLEELYGVKGQQQ